MMYLLVKMKNQIERLKKEVKKEERFKKKKGQKRREVEKEKKG